MIGFFKKTGNNFYLALTELIFRFSFAVFVILFLAECLVPGFVTIWFNPVWLLIVSSVTGIITITKAKNQ